MKIQQKNLKSIFTEFTEGSNIRIEETCLYIEKNYRNKIIFNDCLAFIDHLTCAFSSKSKFGIFAIMISAFDCKMELLNALNLASIGVYKSSFDSLRRALEITLLGFYFDLEKGNAFEYEGDELRSEILDWYKSKSKTPFFKEIKKKLSKKYNFQIVGEKLDWVSPVENLYYKLSDITHTKGLEKSIITLNQTKKFKTTPEFNEKSLGIFLNYFIETTQTIATLYALHNPVLTLGLPVAEKFGFGEVGLFEDYQAKILLKLISESYKTILIEIVKNDNEIQEKIKKIEEMPISQNYIDVNKKFENLRKNLK